MQVAITQPDLEKFIADQLKCGRFNSADELVEAALHRMMVQDSQLEAFDDETIAAILGSDAQFERGEGRDFREVLDELRRRYE